MALSPIFPFEPISTTQPPQGEHWIAQVKWDGVRILTYWDGKEVSLFNRKKNERTYHYPEITENISTFCRADSVIFDGEVIALGPNGKPSFHEVMRRDGLRRLDRVSQVTKEVQIAYMIFDVLYVNGEWVTERSLTERMEILASIVIPNKHVQLVSSLGNGEMLFDLMKKEGMEGIVVKDVRRSYIIDGKDDRWQKIKNYKDVIAAIGGVTLRDGIVNAVLLGLYDRDGKFFYVGHAGTGKLTKQDWRTLTELIKPMVVSEMPFHNKPERIKDAIWVKPHLTAKIKFMEWTEGHNLRQPSIQAFVDIPAKDCTIDQT